MENCHRLLQRQLKRHLGDDLTLSPELLSFIEAINAAYHQADEDRERLERTLEISSQELLQANATMQELLHSVEQQVADRTTDLTRANAELEQTLEKLQKTQTQLIQTEKMSSLGQLVAGIAHEINNPVNFIHGNLDYASQYSQDLLKLVELYRGAYPNPNSAIENFMEAIDLDFLIQDFTKLIRSMKIGVERIRQIVLSLRNFSRIDEAEVKTVDIHEGIDSTLLILQGRLKANSKANKVEVIKEYGDLPLIECYPSQLNQVFMNLIANAIDALEESGKFSNHGSKHHTELEQKLQHILQRNHSLNRLWQNQDKPCVWISTEQKGSDWVKIRIADNGIGIPESLKQRLFDPFFTTKAVGKGTGLGLSISYQIVADRHKGSLTCQSAPGLGTEFVVTIPLRQNQHALLANSHSNGSNGATAS